MQKYDYVEGFCPVIGYRGLYPIAYTQNNRKFEKTKMICTCGTATCKDNCPVFETVETMLPKEDEWQLRDRLIGE